MDDKERMMMFLSSVADITGFIASEVRRIKKKQDWIPTREDAEVIARATCTLEGVGADFLSFMNEKNE